MFEKYRKFGKSHESEIEVRKLGKSHDNPGHLSESSKRSEIKRIIGKNIEK